INSNLAGVTTVPDNFSEPGTVTFTGIFRAKGNEAAMVYVINAQDCFTASVPSEVARVRNRLFAAITRSKAWVRVLGVGKRMPPLIAEFEKAREADFKLSFKYPTEGEREKMMIVNQESIARNRSSLLDFFRSLESGETFVEDYPEDDIKKLRALLDKR
ncbi:MAG: ATP-binding domain-containing protein, partial [Terrimicrobiaceae bacterium]